MCSALAVTPPLGGLPSRAEAAAALTREAASLPSELRLSPDVARRSPALSANAPSELQKKAMPLRDAAAAVVDAIAASRAELAGSLPSIARARPASPAIASCGEACDDDVDGADEASEGWDGGVGPNDEGMRDSGFMDEDGMRLSAGEESIASAKPRLVSVRSDGTADEPPSLAAWTRPNLAANSRGTGTRLTAPSTAGVRELPLLVTVAALMTVSGDGRGVATLLPVELSRSSRDEPPAGVSIPATAAPLLLIDNDRITADAGSVVADSTVRPATGLLGGGAGPSASGTRSWKASLEVATDVAAVPGGDTAMLRPPPATAPPARDSTVGRLSNTMPGGRMEAGVPAALAGTATAAAAVRCAAVNSAGRWRPSAVPPLSLPPRSCAPLLVRGVTMAPAANGTPACGRSACSPTTSTQASSDPPPLLS